MRNIIDNKGYSNDKLIEFFRFAAKSEDGELPSTTARAVDFLISYLNSNSVALLPNPVTAICDWTVHMCVRGASRKTMIPYIKAISGLYSKSVAEGLAPKTDVFKSIMAQLRKGGGNIWNSWLTSTDLSQLVALTKQSTAQTTDAVGVMILFSLINGCMPLTKVARVKKTDISAYTSEDIALLNQPLKRNRRYVFPIEQAGLTPNQLSLRVNSLTIELLSWKRIWHTHSANDTLRSYWAYAALRMGISPSKVLSCLGSAPSALPILSICEKTELSEEGRREITASVAKMFTVNPPRWYVMRLRPRVRFENLQEKLNNLKEDVPVPELFYPCEEIYKRIGRKKETVQKPVIPDIVFFRSRETEVYPLFLKIGDIAWGYRIKGNNGSDAYASIPKNEFERFQQTIGQFTSDYEVAPIGGLTPMVGDEVVVIGGPFQNQEGSVEKILSGESDKIYRIEVVPPKGGPVWRIGLDARLVRKKDETYA